MALQSSGAISMSDINVELGFSSSATLSLNDADARNLAGIASGAISLSDFYGASAVTTIPDFFSWNLNTALGGPGGNYGAEIPGPQHSSYSFTPTDGTYYYQTRGTGTPVEQDTYNLGEHGIIKEDYLQQKRIWHTSISSAQLQGEASQSGVNPGSRIWGDDDYVLSGYYHPIAATTVSNNVGYDYMICLQAQTGQFLWGKKRNTQGAINTQARQLTFPQCLAVERLHNSNQLIWVGEAAGRTDYNNVRAYSLTKFDLANGQVVQNVNIAQGASQAGARTPGGNTTSVITDNNAYMYFGGTYTNPQWCGSNTLCVATGSWWSRLTVANMQWERVGSPVTFQSTGWQYSSAGVSDLLQHNKQGVNSWIVGIQGGVSQGSFGGVTTVLQQGSQVKWQLWSPGGTYEALFGVGARRWGVHVQYTSFNTTNAGMIEVIMGTHPDENLQYTAPGKHIHGLLKFDGSALTWHDKFWSTTNAGSEIYENAVHGVQNGFPGAPNTRMIYGQLQQRNNANYGPHIADWTMRMTIGTSQYSSNPVSAFNQYLSLSVPGQQVLPSATWVQRVDSGFVSYGNQFSQTSPQSTINAWQTTNGGEAGFQGVTVRQQGSAQLQQQTSGDLWTPQMLVGAVGQTSGPTSFNL